MKEVEAFADRLQSLSSAQLFWAIFVLAIAVRVSLLVLFPPPAEVQFAEMDKIARSLATHGTFADAYFCPRGRRLITHRRTLSAQPCLSRVRLRARRRSLPRR